MAKKISIELTNEEALVLLDYLSRCSKKEEYKFEDQAEQRVLWDIEATLESVLIEPLKSNYDELLAKAREKVRDQSD